MKTSILFPILLISSSLSAYTPREHEGNVYQTGTGDVYHDGDYIQFSINFEAACFADRLGAKNSIVQNVASFEDWLKQEKITHDGGAIIYEIDPLNEWYKEGNGYSPSPCDGTYYANQNLTVTLNKSDADVSLINNSVQSFYSELQQKTWPLNYSLDDTKARVATSITNIVKGVYEATADQLRIAAKAKARAKAEGDFLAFLGPNFQGTWYLRSADFRENNYGYALKVGVESANPPLPPSLGDTPIPARLKLKPLHVSATGNFHYVYTY